MGFNLSILTPTKKLLSNAEVESVSLPAYSGELTILEEHSSLITTLEAGVLSYKLKGSEDLKKMAVSWGYCEIVDQEVSILAETAETKEEIDAQRAEMAKSLALEEMSKTDDLSLVEKNSKKVKKAEARLEL